MSRINNIDTQFVDTLRDNRVPLQIEDHVKLGIRTISCISGRDYLPNPPLPWCEGAVIPNPDGSGFITIYERPLDVFEIDLIFEQNLNDFGKVIGCLVDSKSDKFTLLFKPSKSNFEIDPPAPYYFDYKEFSPHNQCVIAYSRKLKLVNK